MNIVRIAGIVLIVLGVLGIAYDRVTYTRERHRAELGPVDISIDERETVTVPTWAGVAVLLVGVGMVLVPGRWRA